MLVGALVVAERALAGRVVDVTLLERDALGLSGLPGQLDGAQRRAGVAAGAAGDHLDEVGRNLGADRRRSTPDDLAQILVGERLQLDDLAAGEERRVDLEVRVLGRRADQRHEPFLDGGQQRVLLRLVEAVDLVEEEDRPLAVAAEAVTGPLHDAAHVVHTRRHG